MFEWVFHWLYNFFWCRFETMTDLFKVYVRFNGGKVYTNVTLNIRYTNVTLKGLKDQLNEINQGLNPRDTSRVKYIWYERPTLDEWTIMFSRLELKNDNVRSMFSIFLSHNMFPWIDMYVTLLRSTEDILNILIPPEDRD